MKYIRTSVIQICGPLCILCSNYHSSFCICSLNIVLAIDVMLQVYQKPFIIALDHPKHIGFNSYEYV